MANKQKAKLNEDLAKDIVTKFNHAYAWRMPFKAKWDRYYKMYRAYLQDQNYPWQSNIWVPVSFSQIETVAPRMVANKPQIDILPRTPEDTAYAKIQSELIDYEWEEMGMDLLMPDAVKSMLIYGTVLLKVYWDKREKEMRKKVDVDPNMPDLGSVEDTELTKIADNPQVDVCDLYDIFWDPRGTDPENCRWMVHRTYRTYEHLEELQAQKIYKNVNLVKDTKIELKDDDKAERYATLGLGIPEELAQAEAGKQMVELLEYWEDDKVVTIANRKIVVRDEANPYNHGKKPFVKIVDHAVPHEFCGIGELEPMETLQYELNSRRNQRLDNVTLALNRMWVVENGAGVDEDELVSDAGGVVHTNKMGSIEAIAPPDVTASSYQEETLVKQDIQQATGVSNYTAGTDAEGLNDTATGISLIQEAGNARFKLKLRNIEAGIKRIGQFMVSLNEQYIEDAKVLRIMGDAGIEWKTVKPDDLRGNFDVVVEAGSTMPSNEAVMRKQVMDAFSLFANDPLINQTELRRIVLEATLPKANTNKLLAPDQQAQMGGMLPPDGASATVEMNGEAQRSSQLDQQGVLQAALAPEPVR